MNGRSVWSEAIRSCVNIFFFSSRRRHTRFDCDWSSDVCSSDLSAGPVREALVMMFWYGPGTGMSGWGSGLMMVGMLVFWGLLLSAVVFGVRYAVRDRKSVV